MKSIWFNVASPSIIRIKECPFGEKVNDDIDNLMIYDSEQVTGCMLNTCCSVTEILTIVNAILEARK